MFAQGCGEFVANVWAVTRSSFIWSRCAGGHFSVWREGASAFRRSFSITRANHHDEGNRKSVRRKLRWPRVLPTRCPLHHHAGGGVNPHGSQQGCQDHHRDYFSTAADPHRPRPRQLGQNAAHLLIRSRDASANASGLNVLRSLQNDAVTAASPDHFRTPQSGFFHSARVPRRMQVFCCAGVSPAIFLIFTTRKDAGETPAARYPAPCQSQCKMRIKNSPLRRAVRALQVLLRLSLALQRKDLVRV